MMGSYASIWTQSAAGCLIAVGTLVVKPKVHLCRVLQDDAVSWWRIEKT